MLQIIVLSQPIEHGLEHIERFPSCCRFPLLSYLWATGDIASILRMYTLIATLLLVFGSVFIIHWYLTVGIENTNSSPKQSMVKESAGGFHLLSSVAPQIDVLSLS